MTNEQRLIEVLLNEYNSYVETAPPSVLSWLKRHKPGNKLPRGKHFCSPGLVRLLDFGAGIE